MSLKIYLAQINNKVGDISFNSSLILDVIKNANEKKCDLVIFPEMSLCGYPCEDLLKKEYFINECLKELENIVAATKNTSAAILIGCPYIEKKGNHKAQIFNALFLIENNEIKYVIKKKSLPNYGVFDENRYFDASSALSYVDFRNKKLAIIICEDFWDNKNLYLLKEQSFDALIVVNSSPFEVNKKYLRLDRAKNFAKSKAVGVIYVNQVGAQDNLVFDGASFAVNKFGQIVKILKDFQEDFVIFDSNDFDKNISDLLIYKNSLDFLNLNDEDLRLVYSACVVGLRDYLAKNNFKNIILGMSGGIDSALVAAISCDAISSDNVKLYALPSRFNSNNSMSDARICSANIGVNLEVISIENIFSSMISTLYDYCSFANSSESSQLARENIQSRIRGNILMAISNVNSSLLISTGNKSELATGYSTIYGDMCGAFNPLKDLYKTQIYQLAKWRNNNASDLFFLNKKNIIPKSIIEKEPSAELRENQKDSDNLGSYEILDKILYEMIDNEKSISEIINKGFDKYLVEKIAKLFYNSEFKRRQSVIGVKISSMSFDKDRRYPITNSYKK